MLTPAALRFTHFFVQEKAARMPAIKGTDGDGANEAGEGRPIRRDDVRSAFKALYEHMRVPEVT